MAEADPRLTRVEAARREVLNARGALVDEVGRLETSARAAVDIRAQLQHSPERAAAVAAGLGFLALGGPKKILKGAKRAVFGRGKAYPSGLLPDEIDAALRRLGDDGEKVRGTLEREFASYLKQSKKKEKGALRSAVVGSILMPMASAAIKGAARRAAAGEPVIPSAGGWGSSYGRPGAADAPVAAPAAPDQDKRKGKGGKKKG